MDDRQQWQRIFRTLTEIAQSQQSQIETLNTDKQFLERYIHLQHHKWSAKTELLQSQIIQMEKEGKKHRRVQAAKLNVVVGMKEQEAMRYKKQFEKAESDLDDFHACLEGLVAESAELKDKLKGNNVETPNGVVNGALEGELRKLRHSFKSLTSEKDCQVSALLREKDFVWNQLKAMEANYSGLIKTKRTEVQQVNEALKKLQANMEDLQLTAKEKTETMCKLEVERGKLELDVRRHRQETEKANEKTQMLEHKIEELNSVIKEKDEIAEQLRNKLAKLRKDATNSKKPRSRNLGSQKDSRSAPVTPLESHPRRGQPRKGKLNMESGDTNRGTSRSSSVRISEPQTSSAVSVLQQCSRERQKRPVSPIKSPRLFSASFKVPKLKSPPPGTSNLTT